MRTRREQIGPLEARRLRRGGTSRHLPLPATFPDSKRMADISTYEHVSEVRVRYAETDQMGVVYHANYLVWCEIGRTDFIRALGRSYADLERDGVTLAVSDASMRFMGSARYDDRVLVFTSLEHVGSRGMRFAYRITSAVTGRTLVTATTSLVSLDNTGRLMRMPAELLQMLTTSPLVRQSGMEQAARSEAQPDAE